MLPVPPIRSPGSVSNTSAQARAAVIAAAIPRGTDPQTTMDRQFGSGRFEGSAIGKFDGMAVSRAEKRCRGPGLLSMFDQLSLMNAAVQPAMRDRR
jgi:hypothetical protein